MREYTDEQKANQRRVIKAMRTGEYGFVREAISDGANGRCAIGVFVEFERSNYLSELGIRGRDGDAIIDFNNAKATSHIDNADYLVSEFGFADWQPWMDEQEAERMVDSLNLPSLDKVVNEKEMTSYE